MRINERQFLESVLNEWGKSIHNNAVDHGWWDNGRDIPTMLCLIHSEVSEALEAYRNDEPIGEELADVIIRTLDMAIGLGIDIGKEVSDKHEYNKGRPYKHGGKVV